MALLFEKKKVVHKWRLVSSDTVIWTLISRGGRGVLTSMWVVAGFVGESEVAGISDVTSKFGVGGR